MSKRIVRLGCGRACGLGVYVTAWKECIALVHWGRGDQHIGPGVSGWGDTAEQALRELRAGLHDRINRHIPGYGVGRKWAPEWFWPVHRLAHSLRDRFVVHRFGHGCTDAKIIVRVAHRFTEPGED